MPKGPQGQKRPADVVSAAVMVGRIATGETRETGTKAGQVKGGKLGGKKRAEALTPERRSEIAQAAARKRWAD